MNEKPSENVSHETYYHFENDLAAYPDCWCFIVWSARGVGKTYSALWYARENHIPIVYMKRTKNDVNLICNENKIGFDASPYVPINRDKGTNIKARRIQDGIGGFYEVEDEETPPGLPIAYTLALSAAKSYKGFDFSRCEWLVFDEFIPQQGEIIRHAEGEMLLDLYMTIRRDREQRGRDPLKLILFANSEEISTPITNVLEVVDIMAEMNATGEEYHETRGILLHHVPGLPEKNTESGIYAAMEGTAWAEKAFGGLFSNNDFSCVKKMSIKGMRPVVGIRHRRKTCFIYQRGDGIHYMTDSAAAGCKVFDLEKETEARRFWLEYGIDLNMRIIDGKVFFKKYSMYDLLFNFKKHFSC